VHSFSFPPGRFIVSRISRQTSRFGWLSMDRKEGKPVCNQTRMMNRKRRFRLFGAFLCASTASWLVLAGQFILYLDGQGHALPRHLGVGAYFFWAALVAPSFWLSYAIGWEWGDGIDILTGPQMAAVLI